MADTQTVPTLPGTSWVAQSGGAHPEGALIGGNDAGNDLFIARSEHNGAIIPGKLVTSHNVAYIAWGGEEHGKDDYEVLVVPADAVSWSPATSEKVIPEKAIPGGISEEGEVLFIGRASHEGTVTVGKVHPSHGVLYISYGGAEVSHTEYEILTLH